jgi:hexosaminidase
MTSDPGRRPAAHARRAEPRRPISRPLAVVLIAGACLITASAAPALMDHGKPAAPKGAPAVKPSATFGVPAASGPLAPEPQIIPKPVSVTAGRGWFTLTAGTRIVAAPGPASVVGEDLAGYLRPATGYPLPVTAGPPRPGDIALVLGAQAHLPSDPFGEAYTIDAVPGGVELAAGTPHGLYDAVQTLRQMLPPWINRPTRQAGPWPVPAVRITDYPRYGYRGLMVDIARHYEPPSAIETLINQAAAYKIDVLHLHLGDDQGFRVVINGFPRLARVGGQGSVGTGGRVMDPGGYWTQAQYQAVVADAAAHFITVVPEVDSPGHSNAIIMSEYYDTGNPLLHDPQNINCGEYNPPVWNYTEDVGYSALCPGSSNTWVIMSHIVDQLASMSPGPYYDMGGDEVPATLLGPSAYAAFVNEEAAIVHAAGKTLMGWADIAGPGTRVLPGSVAEYWQPAGGSSSETITAHEAVAKGMKIVMAPADHAYLDQKYLGGSRGDAPPGLGQTWACPVGCDLDAAYDWNPGSFVTGVTDRNVIGVEGPVWTETLVDLSTVDYMVFPRLMALAEVAWSPSAARYDGSPAERNFLSRMAGQGGRLMAAGVNFYPSTEVHWRLEAIGATLTAGARGQVAGALATVAAPGLAPGAISATIHWGDGTTSRAGVTGRGPTGIRLNSLYTVPGQHTYTRPGPHHGTVTIQAPHQAPVTVPFTVLSS